MMVFPHPFALSRLWRSSWPRSWRVPLTISCKRKSMNNQNLWLTPCVVVSTSKITRLHLVVSRLTLPLFVVADALSSLPVVPLTTRA
jgi:hypothetical protein